MRIAVLHPAIGEDASLEDQDTLVQVRAVSESLERLGHEAEAVPCTLDLAALRDDLNARRPELIFNLMESVDGADSLQYVPVAVLDALGLAYTGNPTEAVFQTTHKLLAKQLLHLAGLPTPAWLVEQVAKVPRRVSAPACSVAGGADVLAAGMESRATGRDSESCATGRDSESHATAGLRPPCIVKAVWEHGSRGLDDQSVILEGTEETVVERLRAFASRTGRPCFAEQFIHGREFNLAMLDGADGPQVLPPGEIDFSGFPKDKPRIVGYRAKWEADAFEYHHTPRGFDFPAEDAPLLTRLGELALACWRLFDLRSYVRVDFRVDAEGRPWILEVNTNPCLSPDAGFASAAAEAGISFDQTVERIVEAARPRHLRDS